MSDRATTTSEPSSKRPRRHKEKVIAGKSKGNSKVSNRKTKKDDFSNRKKAKKDDANDFRVTLCEDALLHVMSYLPPRDLLRISSTCSVLRKHITVPLALKSAMIHGGYAKKSAEFLYVLLKDGSIHPPSPLRLLRLVNGKRCEFCFEKRVLHVRPGNGVFACWDCIEKCCRVTDSCWGSQVFSHPRVRACCCTRYEREEETYYLWNVQNKTEWSSEELVGPVVTEDDARRIDNKSYYYKHKGQFDQYIKENFNHLPPMECYKEYVDTYEEIKARADREVLARVEKKKNIAIQNRDNRKAKVKDIVSNLGKLLEEDWRESALQYKDINQKDPATPPKRTLPLIRFRSPFVDKLLNPYVISPSKMRKKHLKEIAEQINSRFGLVRDTNFFAFEFLSDEENDVFECKLKRSIVDKINSYDTLVATGEVTQDFFDLLEKNQFVAAVAHIKSNNLGYLLLSEEETVKTREMAPFRYLADSAWHIEFQKKTFGGEKIAGGGRQRLFTRVFSASKDTFRDGKAALVEFEDWLLTKPLWNRGSPRVYWTRLRACKYVPMAENLLKRDFMAVIKLIGERV